MTVELTVQEKAALLTVAEIYHLSEDHSSELGDYMLSVDGPTLSLVLAMAATAVHWSVLALRAKVTRDAAIAMLLQNPPTGDKN